MLRPMLFVGCGGSGLRTLRRLRRELEYRLSVAGVGAEDFPTAWQFLVVDVPSSEQLEDSALKEYSHGSYVGLSDPGVGYRFSGGVDDQLIRRDSSADDFVTWRPEPEKVIINIMDGAGSYRAVGRVVGAYSMNKNLVPRLQNAVSQLKGDGARSQLRHIAAQLGLPDASTGDILEPVAVIVSSLGGGAGSGIYLDVADAMRGLTKDGDWLRYSIGILYDPSIFYTQDAFEKGGIPANSLAAISELVAGHWNPWPAPPYLPSANQIAGTKRGPQFPLLFGTSNGKVNLPNSEAVYETVANIFANLTISPDVSNSFYEHLQANWSALSEKSDRSPAIQDSDSTSKLGPISSIGFGRVSLGRQRFGRYASERMTRLIVQRILTQHEDDETRDGKKTQPQRIKELVARDRDLSGGLVTRFLADCGLSEGTPANNQVVDALRDEGRITEAIMAIQKQVDDRVSDPKQVIAQFQQIWGASSFIRKTSQRTELPGIRTAILDEAAKWSAAIQERVMDTVVGWVAEQGLAVTLEIVREAATVELAKTFPAELRAEATQRLNEATDAGTNVQAVVSGAKMRRGVVPMPIKGALKDLVRVQVEALAERDLREVAAGILEDLAANLFGPIQKALGSSLESARREYGDSVFALLSGEGVPTELEPPANEKLVDLVVDYPGIYADLIKKTAESEVSAVIKAFSGEIGDESQRRNLPANQRAWVSSQTWMPDLSKLGATEAATASPMRPSFSFEVEQVKQRCASWLTFDTTSAIGSYMSETLGGYLTDGSPTEQLKRANVFARLLDDAFSAAIPFVQLNHAWLTSQFGYDIAYNFEFSKIPIGPSDNPAAFHVVDLSLRKYVPNDDLRRSMYSTSQLGDIEIYSVLNPFCPSGAVSLASPIVTSYQLAASNRSPSAADGFYAMRRARPLLQSIPLPYTSQITIVRGWLTAVLLDAIRIDESGNKCTIKADDKTYQFLSPPLGNPKTRWDWLGMALESALLAQMIASINDEGPLNALTALLKLGSPEGAEQASGSYPNPNEALTTVTPPGLAAFGSNGTVPGDVRAALESLMVFKDFEVVPTRDWVACGYHLQLAPLVVTAAEQMLAVVDQIGMDRSKVPGIPGA